MPQNNKQMDQNWAVITRCTEYPSGCAVANELALESQEGDGEYFPSSYVSVMTYGLWPVLHALLGFQSWHLCLWPVRGLND